MAALYHDFIQRFIKKWQNIPSMKETSNKYGERKLKSKSKSKSHSENKRCNLCCFKRNSKFKSNSKDANSYSPVLYTRDSKNRCSSSYALDGDGSQPFLNYGNPNYQFQTSNLMTYNSVFVDVPSNLEDESLREKVNEKSTSPLMTKKKYKPRNITECNIAQEESKLVYNKVPSFIEVIENPTKSTFKQVREAKLHLIETERKGQLERMKTASIETTPVVSKPEDTCPMPDTCPTPETSYNLPDEERPEVYEESPGKTESRSFHSIHTKHCIACIIESMKRLPDCCIKKALFLNPIYISNDCSSKPVYLQ